MTIETEIRKAFDAYIRTYFTNREVGHVVDRHMHRPLSVIGTGSQEVGRTFEKTKELYINDVSSLQNSIKVTYDFVDIHPLSPTTAILTSIFDISTVVDDLSMEMKGLRMTLVYTKIDQKWGIVHKHISTATQEHSDEESYPLERLQEMNRILEERVDKKTLELQQKNQELKGMLAKITQLEKLLPICMYCNKIRDSKDWVQLEKYLSDHTSSEFSHSVCDSCLQEQLDLLGINENNR